MIQPCDLGVEIAPVGAKQSEMQQFTPDEIDAGIDFRYFLTHRMSGNDIGGIGDCYLIIKSFSFGKVSLIKQSRGLFTRRGNIQSDRMGMLMIVHYRKPRSHFGT